MKLKNLNPEEIFIGAMLQFPLYFIVGWWVLPIQLLCGILWAVGGIEGGSKLARRVLIPLVITLPSTLILHKPLMPLALLFMVWLAPSYGKSTWLYKVCYRLSKGSPHLADILTRGICYLWYWTAFILGAILTPRLY